MDSLKEIVKNSFSYTEVLRKLGINNPNGLRIKKLKEEISNYDTSHFIKNGYRNKYEIIEKE